MVPEKIGKRERKNGEGKRSNGSKNSNEFQRPLELPGRAGVSSPGKKMFFFKTMYDHVNPHRWDKNCEFIMRKRGCR